jgi:predicted DNA-binding protein with PD1-like motif
MQVTSGPITAHSIRLTPGQDLVPALEYAAAAACHSTASGAAFILTAVGSLSSVTLRLASAHSGGITAAKSSPERTWNEPVEVTSMVGTMAVSDEFIIGKHWHMSISDEEGFSFGGHVMAATVWTTMEIVLGTIGNGVSFSREMDSATGYRELVVRQPPQQQQQPQAGEDREEEKETKQQEITEEAGDNGQPSWMAKLKNMKVKAEPVEPEKETSQPGWQMRNMLKKKRDMESGIIESGGEDEESTEDYDDEDDENDVWANVNMKKPGLGEEEVANQTEEPGGEASSAKKMDKGEQMQSHWDHDRGSDNDWSDVKVKNSDERSSDKKDKKSKKKEKDSDNDSGSSDSLSLSSHSSHSHSHSSKKSNDKDKSKHDEKKDKKEKKKDKKKDKDMDKSKHDEKDKKDETPEERAKRKEKKEKEKESKDKKKVSL